MNPHVEQALKEFREETGEFADQEPAVAPEPAAAPAVTDVAAPAAAGTETVAPTPRTLSLDDMLPDDEIFPPTFRGKATVRDLAEDRRQAIQRAIDAGTAKNAAESRLLVMEATLKTLMSQKSAPEPEKPRTTAEELRTRVNPADMLDDPDGVLGGVIDTTRQLSKQDIDTTIKPIADELAQMRRERSAERQVAAHRQAGKMLSRDEASWIADIDNVVIYVERNNLNAEDPQSYVAAGRWLESIANSHAPKAAPAAVPEPAPAPGPPVGSGAPSAQAATPKNGNSQLTNHDRENLNATFAAFPNLTPAMIEEITNEAATSRAELRSRRVG